MRNSVLHHVLLRILYFIQSIYLSALFTEEYVWKPNLHFVFTRSRELRRDGNWQLYLQTISSLNPLFPFLAIRYSPKLDSLTAAPSLALQVGGG